MYDGAELDVAANAQAKRENDRLSYHGTDRPCVMRINSYILWEAQLKTGGLHRRRLG